MPTIQNREGVISIWMVVDVRGGEIETSTIFVDFINLWPLNEIFPLYLNKLATQDVIN